MTVNNIISIISLYASIKHWYTIDKIKVINIPYQVYEICIRKLIITNMCQCKNKMFTLTLKTKQKKLLIAIEVLWGVSNTKGTFSKGFPQQLDLLPVRLCVMVCKCPKPRFWPSNAFFPRNIESKYCLKSFRTWARKNIHLSAYVCLWTCG